MTEPRKTMEAARRSSDDGEMAYWTHGETVYLVPLAVETAIREQERQRYSDLVEAARRVAHTGTFRVKWCSCRSALTHPNPSCVMCSLRAALAAIEQEGRDG